MAEPTSDPEVIEALTELQQYLSDVLPPLVVAESIKVLMNYPPQLVASSLHGWTSIQYRGGGSIPLSDFLYHAVKKIHLVGEYRLVPSEPFREYIEGLKKIVLAYCPPEDRDFLKGNLDRLGDAPEASLSQPVDMLFRQSGGAAREHPLASEKTRAAAPSEGFRHVGLFLERLERQLVGTRVPALPEAKGEMAAQALAAAARGSQDRKEFEYSLERLNRMGIGAGTEEVFRALGRSLPGWVLPENIPVPAEDSNLKAMRRIVTQVEDPVEGAARFQQMVKAAIDRFNEGSLGQAVSMLELAERLISEKEVDAGTAELVRRKADEALDPERLRKYAESPEQHGPLRRVLRFFPALSPEGLLAELQREVKRERRRLLLLLLEIHGESARAAAFERLKPVLGQAVGEEEWYFRRNLLYILRRTPRPADAPLEEEAEVVARHCELRYPPPLLKEAIASLGQIKHEKAERALTLLLADIETMLSTPGEAPYEAKESRLLLDRVVASLARFGTPGARRAVVDHALKRKAELGDTLARLAEMSGQDFSDDAETADRLLEALRSNLPFKIFGLVLQQNDQTLQHLVEALSATPLPAVRKVFKEIVTRFRDRPFGRTAAKALAGFDRAAAPPVEAPTASLTGDLEVFGLPALLQSLADSAVNGSLGLQTPGGEVFGVISLRGGKLLSCQTGTLQGEEAFYQLLERVRPGKFLFTRGAGASAKGADAGEAGLRDVLPLILEGMRRYDEFQQAQALVPDGMLLKPTAVKPTTRPDEKDGALVRGLWNAVSRGATPLECEASVAADSYRIRRLLVHWVDTGALTAG
jgi:hypothetical protein